MAQSQFRSIKKVSGKKFSLVRKKRQCDLGGVPAHTLIGSKKEKIKRVMGGNEKKSLLRTEIVLVNEGDKVTKLAIEGVNENPANIHYTRRNVITKGAIVKTEKGEVVITSRPGQSGSLFGKFVK